jgi:hypothetical protein
VKKIVLIPLDERPCNYLFPQDLLQDTDFQIVVPPMTLMGQKKQPGKIEQLWSFLMTELQDADGAVLSIDTLLYGGIVPSRLHHDTTETLMARLAKLEDIREAYPHLPLYAFNLIMRNPTYSSSDEEPDYYSQWGREIHLRGTYEHKQQEGVLTAEEEKAYQTILATLDHNAWDDYIGRRQKNLTVNKKVIEYVETGVLDQLIIPQDDASPYGLTALNQKEIRTTIKTHHVMKQVYMYPGADEVANTLLSKMITSVHQVRPKVFLKYTSEQGKFVIPLYEDRPLGETVKYQVMAAGGMVVHSEFDADIILLINTPANRMLNASEAYKKGLDYDVYRNLVEAVEYASYMIAKNIPVAVADVAYGNGADLELIQLLNEHHLLFQLAGYAGWNTSSNTLGTVIPQAMIYHIFGETTSHLDFLSLRYTEDAGYCAVVRQEACQDVLPNLGLNYFTADAKRGLVSEEVKRLLTTFLEEHIQDETYQIVIDDVWMPWVRMFEVGLRTHVVRR